MFDLISKFRLQKGVSTKKRTAFDLSILLFISVLVCLPILLKGIPDSMDIPQQYQLAQSFYDSILNGQIYPSWADLPNYGYGDVSVRFYPPLAYYILSLFRFVSGSWFDASCLFFISLFFISGLGVYLFAQERFSKTASLIAGIIYIWLPYHVMQIYVGGVFAEFTAIAIIPFCLLFIDLVCQKGRLIDIFGLALFVGLIFITHLPTIIIISSTFLIYSLLTIRRTEYVQTLLKLAVSVFFSFLLSCFYLVRVITELDYVKHSGETFSTGYYSYKTQFVLSYLFPFADVTVNSLTETMNLVVLITLGVLIPGIFYYYRKTTNNKTLTLTNITIITFFSLLMSTPLSLMIWEMLPILQKIQFPFRWLTIFTLGTAIFSAAGITWATEMFETPKRYISYLIFGFLFLSVSYTYNEMMNPQKTYPREIFNSLTNEFKIAPSYECWWAIWTKKVASKEKKDKSNQNINRPDFLPDKILINNRQFEIRDWKADEKNFTINAGESGQAQVSVMYYPHWKATVNSQPVEVTPTETGMVSLPVPSQESNVRLYFQEPQKVIVSYYVSGLSWIIVLGFLSGSLLLINKNGLKIKEINKNEQLSSSI